uniref:Uncharacterized protein n=1 Tax=Biomphalaria glabrata TaxID=6526 RepID=A0A2C9LJI9_BIOGL
MWKQSLVKKTKNYQNQIKLLEEKITSEKLIVQEKEKNIEALTNKVLQLENTKSSLETEKQKLETDKSELQTKVDLLTQEKDATEEHLTESLQSVKLECAELSAQVKVGRHCCCYN